MTTPRDWRPTWRPTCAGRRSWAICAISSAWDARRWHSPQLGTAHDDPRCLAEHAALEPVGNYAFTYEPLTSAQG
jgi:hypothetical protein